MGSLWSAGNRGKIMKPHLSPRYHCLIQLNSRGIFSNYRLVSSPALFTYTFSDEPYFQPKLFGEPGVIVATGHNHIMCARRGHGHARRHVQPIRTTRKISRGHRQFQPVASRKGGASRSGRKRYVAGQSAPSRHPNPDRICLLGGRRVEENQSRAARCPGWILRRKQRPRLALIPSGFCDE